MLVDFEGVFLKIALDLDAVRRVVVEQATSAGASLPEAEGQLNPILALRDLKGALEKRKFTDLRRRVGQQLDALEAGWIPGMTLTPGVRETIARLAAGGITSGVITLLGSLSLNTLLGPETAKLLQATITRDELLESPIGVDPLLFAGQRLKSPPADTLYVCATLKDLEHGRRGGFKVATLPSKKSEILPILSARPDYFLYTLHELPELLDFVAARG